MGAGKGAFTPAGFEDLQTAFQKSMDQSSAHSLENNRSVKRSYLCNRGKTGMIDPGFYLRTKNNMNNIWSCSGNSSRSFTRTLPVVLSTQAPGLP